MCPNDLHATMSRKNTSIDDKNNILQGDYLNVYIPIELCNCAIDLDATVGGTTYNLKFQGVHRTKLQEDTDYSAGFFVLVCIYLILLMLVLVLVILL